MKRKHIHVAACHDMYVVDSESALHDATHFERGLMLASIGFVMICVFGSIKFGMQGPAMLIGFALVILGFSWSSIRLVAGLFRPRSRGRGGLRRTT